MLCWDVFINLSFPSKRNSVPCLQMQAAGRQAQGMLCWDVRINLSFLSKRNSVPCFQMQAAGRQAQRPRGCCAGMCVSSCLPHQSAIAVQVERKRPAYWLA